MENEPDCFQVNDWLVLEHPEVYAALRFLHWDVFYDCALKIWHQQGRPQHILDW